MEVQYGLHRICPAAVLHLVYDIQQRLMWAINLIWICVSFSILHFMPILTVPWSNGNSRGFDPHVPRSNRGGTTNFIFFYDARKAGTNVPAFSFCSPSLMFHSPSCGVPLERSFTKLLVMPMWVIPFGCELVYKVYNVTDFTSFFRYEPWRWSSFSPIVSNQLP